MEKNKKRGFTLVELIVVIAVVAILVAVLVPTLTSVIDKAKESADSQLAANITTALAAADENDMVTAPALRAYLKADGIDKVVTKKKDNVIVFDYNAKKAEVLKLTDGEITPAVTTATIKAESEKIAYNKAPVFPEEIIAGKVLLSTDGNSLAEAIYELRQGNVTQKLVDQILALDKTADKSLALGIQKIIGQSLFIGAGGESKAYRITGSVSGLTLKSVGADGDYSSLKYALFAENCEKITSTTFERAGGIKRVVVPASVTEVASDAFVPLYPENANTELIVAFGKGDYTAVKEAVVAAGGKVAGPAQTVQAIRDDSDIFFSGITEYRDIADFEALKANLGAPAGTALRLSGRVAVTENITLPNGVTLLLPCMDDDEGYNSVTGYNPNGTEAASGAPNGSHIVEYSHLTVAAGITLTVQGNMLVNAVTGQPKAGHSDMDVNGGYASVELDGNILVENGGVLDCCGYIAGPGMVEAEEGGEVRDLYVVRHWRGGSQALSVYPTVYPMNEYDMHNITARIRLSEKARLVGTVKMFASGSYYYTRFPQVDKANGLIRLKGGAAVERTYAGGREVYTITGGADIASSTLEIAGMDLSTKDFVYPIDGDITINLNDGDYSFGADVKGFKFMPGAALTLDPASTLSVPENITVVFYDEFNDVENVPGTQYPADRGPAELKIAGTASFAASGSFAGHIVCDGDAIIKIKSDEPVISFEAKGYTGGVLPLSFTRKTIREGFSAVRRSTAENGFVVFDWLTDEAASQRFCSLSIMSETVDSVTTADKAEVDAAMRDYDDLSDAAKALSADNYALLTALYEKVTVKATIGDRTFMTLQSAIDAAVSGDVIKMADDTYEAITIPDGLRVVIDLGGFKLAKNAVLVANAGTLTLKNGTLDNTGEAFYDVVFNTAVLTLENLTVNGGYGIVNGGKSLTTAKIESITNCLISNAQKFAVTNYGTLNTVSGGKITCNKLEKRAANNGGILNNGTIVAIENLIIDGHGRGISNDGEIKSLSNCRISVRGSSAAALYNDEEIGSVGGCRLTAEKFYVVYNRTSDSKIDGLDAVITGNYNCLIKNSGKLSIEGGYFKNDSESGDIISDSFSYKHDDSFNISRTHFKQGYTLAESPLSKGEYAGYRTLTEGFAVSYNLTVFDDVSASFTPSYPIAIQNYPAGATVQAAPFNPRKLNSASYSFIFKGWTDADGNPIDISAVKGDVDLYESYDKSILGDFVELTAGGTVTKYKNMQTALDTLKYGDKAIVKLTGNIEEKVIVPRDLNINLTLDLNGFTFGAYATPLTVYDTLTIKDSSAAKSGKMVSETTNILNVMYDNDEVTTVNLLGGNFIGEISISENCVVNIKGGHFKAESDIFKLTFSDNSVVNIDGGDFLGRIYMDNNTAAINIHGGDFYNADNIEAVYVNEGKLRIEGGSFYSAGYAVKIDNSDLNVTVTGGRYKSAKGRDNCFSNKDLLIGTRYKLSETPDDDGYFAVVASV